MPLSFRDQLAHYAAHHRDPRNKLTHLFGIPLLSFALLLALAWLPIGSVSGVKIDGALVVAVLVIAFWLALDVPFGLATAVAFVPLVVLARRLAHRPEATWILAAAAVVGVVLQAIGHLLERRRPALADNLLQIFIAPLFLVAEAAFALGLRPDLERDVARRARGHDP